MSSLYADGSAQAPSGTPSLPNLLTGYSTRPPWEVAGVDYAVGVPAGTVLKDPSTISMTGVSVSASSHTITITGNNVTLDGYDFGLAGGWGIIINSGAANTTIENSHFLVGANNHVPINAGAGVGNVTVAYNAFDGGSSQSDLVFGMIGYAGNGTFTAQYNSFVNVPADGIDFGGGPMTTIVKYNVFENLGTAPGSHPDAIQYARAYANNSVFAFNTVYQPNPSGAEGIQIAAQGGSTLTNTTVTNNVVISKAGAIEMSYSIAIQQFAGNTINGVTVANNYIDSSGAYGPFYPPTGSNLSFGGNVNLTSGAVFANPSGTTPIIVSTPPVVSAVTAVTASPGTGTEGVGTVIVLTVAFNAAQVVAGTPTLSLNDGGSAVYTGGSGTSSLTFTYKVGSSDQVVAALAVTGVNLPAGASIKDASGTASILTAANVTLPGLAINPTPAPAPAPTVVADSASTPQGTPVSINVLADDTDPGGTINPASVAVKTAAGHGATAVNAATGAITYTPATGFSGTDTFTYTVANTNGLTSGPATVTVNVIAPVSGVPGPSGYADGASGAPSGAAQLPTILSGYTAPPPWQVAGVNYAVGVAAGTVLKDPSSISMTGVTVNATNHTVTVNGNNVTLSGYNFGLANGWTVIVNGANDTIQNSKFVVGSGNGSNGTVLSATTSSSNFNFIGNEVDGANVAVTAQQGSAMSIASSGTVTIQYNYLHNSGGDMIDFNRSSAPEVDIIQYNLFADIGVNTAHADTLQWYNTQIAAGSDIGFNTVYQNVNQPGPGNGALVVLSEGPQSTMTGLTVNNDTVIQTANVTNANFSVGFYADLGGTASNIVIHDLYIDPTGPMGWTKSPWFPTAYYGDNLATPTVMSNVVNMLTGAQVVVPDSSTKTPYGLYTYNSSGSTAVLSDVYGLKASITSGTLVAGQKIAFTVTLDAPYTVTGAPGLTLNDGGTAVYTSGSGTSSLVFTYTVGSSDKVVSTLAITGVTLPNGASIKDAYGNAANLAGANATITGVGVNPGSGVTPPNPSNATFAVAPLNAVQSEGNSGSKPFTFTVTRATDTSAVQTVAWSLTGATANPANAADFVGGVVPTGVLTFAVGQTTQTITVNVAGDTTVEPNEGFNVVLSGPTGGATITTATAAGTILNDDTGFSIVSTTGSHAEGNSGSTPFVFTVTRSGLLTASNTVTWYTTGPATGSNVASVGPNDFVGGVAPGGTLTFAAGIATQTVTVNIQGDTLIEPNEYFQVGLGTPSGGASLIVPTALAEVVNDDTGFTIAGTDAVKLEGNSGTTAFVFTVTRYGNTAGTNSISWLAVGAQPNPASKSDFANGSPLSGGLVFTPGQTTQTITLQVSGDTKVEPNEQFTVLLRNASGGAQITVNNAQGTILNDDAATPNPVGGTLTTLASADFNGDGKADSLGAASNGDLYIIDGSSGARSAVSESAVGLKFVSAVDLNGDGKADLLVTSASGGLYDWTMNGSTVRQADLITTLGAGVSVAQTAASTGAGSPAEILLHNAGSGVAQPWMMLQVQGGTIVGATNYTTQPSM
jgi:hypothetical protein